ncbi:MAG TPA: ABC transporter substrate-binding protein [Bacteroidota bacterium]|nr:ABC transporter substrate-binding protein [Bacteroidota bacterium]
MSFRIFWRCRMLMLLFACLAAGRIQAQNHEQVQYSADADRMFSAALSRFREGSYEEAGASFDSLVRITPAHQRTTAAYVMSAKSLFELKNYPASRVRAQELLDKFPQSGYRPDIYELLGLNAMMLQQYEEAARMFLKARSATADSAVAAESASYLDLLLSGRLDPQSIRKIYREVNDRNGQDLLALALAEKYHAAGDANNLGEALAMISPGQHSPGVDKRIKSLRQDLAKNVAIKIGVLLPSASSSAPGGIGTLANEVFDGIQEAIDEFKASSPDLNVSLEIRNVNGDGASLSEVRALAASPDLLCIVGPLFSNHALQYAPIADEEKIPMISPTANANDIAAKSRYVFQTNPDVRMRGRAMALYAVRELGLKKIAVLSSSAAQSKLLAGEFAREARSLGAEIAAEETYNKDSSDLREQFMKIREAGATSEPSVSFAGKITRKQIRSMERAGADREILDEARRKKQSVSVTRLFGPRGKSIADSLHLPLVVSLGETFNLEVPITGIQGIFAAIGESDEIGVIASQMSYFNVNAQLLGSGEWYDLSQLEANKRYVDGLVFLSDNFVRPLDSAYAAFEQSFVRFKKKSPTRNTLYGYDTMNLLLSHIREGVRSRLQMARALEQEKNYRGVHGTITLDPGRVNSNVHILKFKNNEVLNVTELHLN